MELKLEGLMYSNTTTGPGSVPQALLFSTLRILQIMDSE